MACHHHTITIESNATAPIETIQEVHPNQIIEAADDAKVIAEAHEGARLAGDVNPQVPNDDAPIRERHHHCQQQQQLNQT